MNWVGVLLVVLSLNFNKTRCEDCSLEDKQAVVEQLTQVSKMLKLKVTYKLNFSVHLSVCEGMTGLESVFVTV
jgi:hypothetical protein